MALGREDMCISSGGGSLSLSTAGQELITAGSTGLTDPIWDPGTASTRPAFVGALRTKPPREAAACKARPWLHLNPNNARSPAAAALACGQGSPCQPVLSAPFPAFPHPLLNHNKRSLVSSPIKATGAGLVKTNSYKRFPLNKTQIFGLYIPRNENKHKKKERD